MKKQNIKLVLLVALVGINCNAFASGGPYKGGAGTPVTIANNGTQNGTVTFQTNGNVKVNDLDHTVYNNETFTITPNGSFAIVPEYYSINGGVGIMIDVENNGILGPNGGVVSQGNYYFPDVDADGTKLETSEVDSVGTADIDATGGGWATGLTASSNLTFYTLSLAGTTPLNTAMTGDSVQVNMNYSAPSSGDAQLAGNIISDGQTFDSGSIINGDGY